MNFNSVFLQILRVDKVGLWKYLLYLRSIILNRLMEFVWDTLVRKIGFGFFRSFCFLITNGSRLYSPVVYYWWSDLHKKVDCKPIHRSHNLHR